MKVHDIGQLDNSGGQATDFVISDDGIILIQDNDDTAHGSKPDQVVVLNWNQIEMLRTIFEQFETEG